MEPLESAHTRLSWKTIIIAGLVSIGGMGMTTQQAEAKRVADSPAARFAWQKPPKYATLSNKEKHKLMLGKVTVQLTHRKNEKGKKMLVTLARGVIKSPIKKAFKTLAQLNKAQDFMPRMFYSKIIKKLDKNSWHVLRKLKIAWKVIKINTRIRLIPPTRYEFNLRRHLKNDIKDSVGAYTFESINGGKHTLITYTNYSDSGRWIPGFIRNPILRKDLPGVIHAIRKRTLSNHTWRKKK